MWCQNNEFHVSNSYKQTVDRKMIKTQIVYTMIYEADQ